MTQQRTGRTVTRETWIETAFAALAEGGIEQVRVEALAKRMKVTKGSFYWHFRDRADLFTALLDTWKRGRIEAIIAQTSDGDKPPQERLRALLRLYVENANPKGTAIELAIRDWARKDVEAAAAVAAVDRERLRCVSRLFALMGIDAESAFTRAFLFYSFVFGQSLIISDDRTGATSATKRACEPLLVG